MWCGAESATRAANPAPSEVRFVSDRVPVIAASVRWMLTPTGTVPCQVRSLGDLPSRRRWLMSTTRCRQPTWAWLTAIEFVRSALRDPTLGE